MTAVMHPDRMTEFDVALPIFTLDKAYVGLRDAAGTPRVIVHQGNEEWPLPNFPEGSEPTTCPVHDVPTADNSSDRTTDVHESSSRESDAAPTATNPSRTPDTSGGRTGAGRARSGDGETRSDDSALRREQRSAADASGADTTDANGRSTSTTPTGESRSTTGMPEAKEERASGRSADTPIASCCCAQTATSRSTSDSELDPPCSASFEWGYRGAGPRALARSILADHLGGDPPVVLTLTFRDEVIANLTKPGFGLPSAWIAKWLGRHLRGTNG